MQVRAKVRCFYPDTRRKIGEVFHVADGTVLPDFLEVVDPVAKAPAKRRKQKEAAAPLPEIEKTPPPK